MMAAFICAINLTYAQDIIPEKTMASMNLNALLMQTQLSLYDSRISVGKETEAASQLKTPSDISDVFNTRINALTNKQSIEYVNRENIKDVLSNFNGAYIEIENPIEFLKYKSGTTCVFFNGLLYDKTFNNARTTARQRALKLFNQ